MSRSPDGSCRSVITITQQYGCEGHAVAAKLAYRLRWTLSGQAEIAATVAEMLGITVEQIRMHYEQAFTLPDRFLLSMRHATSTAMECWAGQSAVTLLPEIQERLYHKVLGEVIEARARGGQQVIVGHGAQALLAGWPDVLHVRLVAPLEQRVRYAMHHECQENEARARVFLRRKDRRLAHYIRSQYHRDLNDPLLYDLVLNSATLDREDQVSHIIQALGQYSRQEMLA